MRPRIIFELGYLLIFCAIGAENDFNRVILAIPKTGFKERRRPSSAAEIAAVSVRDNLFWVRPPSRQARL